MLVGFDIDDIVLDTYIGLAKASNDLFGIEIPRKPKDFLELSRRLDDDQRDILFTFTLNNFSYLNVNNSSLELMHLLKEKQDKIIFITRRPLNVEDGLRKILDLIIPMPYILRICNGFTKSEYACHFGLTHFIEDRYKYARSLAEKDVKVFLNKKPWNNYREKHPNIYEFRNWDYVKYKLGLV